MAAAPPQAPVAYGAPPPEAYAALDGSVAVELPVPGGTLPVSGVGALPAGGA